ncbi:helix-turn-helix transcriptional regulator [Halopseudomonas salegens]|uniref:DNA-binding transcriptional regulator, CsgD family n=1 Tax=Halopseudomonas salegens TaxID=1434072 RepID=A0A1H2HF38_9GAMM|nr:helix-turn-helix transcriptional regulator [Halopseudomonas salegens]SDU30443.1 DNA-binding transcriptional regulator, CsgD family [Halopseudomonas salegens]
MINSEQQWLDVVDCFADAAVSGNGWYNALERLAHATGSEFGQLICLGAQPPIPFNVWTVDPIVSQEFDQLGYHDPALNPRVRAGTGIPELVVRADADFITPDQARHHPHYKWARHHGLGYICLTPLIIRPNMLIGISVGRRQETGHITSAQRQIFASLAAHMRAAIRTQLLLESEAAALLVGALEAMSLTAFACDRAGQVIGMTPKAEQLAGRGEYLKLRARLLHAEFEHETLILSKAIKTAANGLTRPGDPLLHSFFLHSASAPLSPVIVDVISLPQQSFSFGFRPQVMVVVRGLEHDDDQLVAALRAGFDVTAAEARVAILLADGLSPQAIARQRDVSVNTVRSQLRSLYDKLGVSRQSELAARLRPLR